MGETVAQTQPQDERPQDKARLSVEASRSRSFCSPLRRVGIDRQPHRRDGRGVQAHLRRLERAVGTAPDRVLRRVLHARDPRVLHQQAVRLQDRRADRAGSGRGRHAKAARRLGSASTPAAGSGHCSSPRSPTSLPANASAGTGAGRPRPDGLFACRRWRVRSSVLLLPPGGRVVDEERDLDLLVPGAQEKPPAEGDRGEQDSRECLSYRYQFLPVPVPPWPG